MKKFFLILMIFLIPIAVYSNSGPPIIDPTDQSIVFNEKSGVSLIEEWVTISFKDKNFQGSTELDLGTGHVSVKYKIKNLDDHDKELDVLFISPEIDYTSIKVVKDGKEIKGTTIERELKLPKNWDPKAPKEIIEPMSNKKLYRTPNSIYTPNYSFSGTRFKVDFKPKEIITLDISYKSSSGLYRPQKITNMVYSQIYYLTPAKFWEGDSKVNLKVVFPRDSKTKLHSNIPLNKTNSYTYEGNLDGIPDKEWIYTFVESGKLIFGTNDRATHNSLVIIIALIAFIIGLALRRKNYQLYGIILWLLSIVFLMYFFKPSYGFMFIAFIFGPWILLFVLIVVGIIIKNRKQL